MTSFLLENTTNVFENIANCSDNMSPNVSSTFSEANTTGTLRTCIQNISSTNSLGQDSTDNMKLPASFVYVYYTIRALWSVLAIVGNTLTIVVVSKYSQLHTANNFLICNLAIADLLGGVLTPLFFVHDSNLTSPLFVPVCLIEKASKSPNLDIFFYFK